MWKETSELIENLRNGEEKKTFTDQEFSQLKANSYNNTIGRMNENDGVECSICKNKGLIMVSQLYEPYNYYVEVMKDCECMAKRRTIMQAQKSGLGDYIKKRSNDYIAEQEWQKEYKNKMIDFCKNHAEDNVWFSIIGQSGAGKTLLCSIIANHLLYNINRKVIYITWTDFISRLKRDMMGDNANEVSDYLEEIKNVDVLFIDELLKKYNETDLKYIIEIINYRYTNNLKTLITSEKTTNELLDIDEATFSRMIEKAGNYIINIEKDRNKNYRLKNIQK